MSIKTPFGAFDAIGTLATAATGTIAIQELGDNQNHTTVIDIASLNLITTTNASLGCGKLLYTFPAGDIVITQATIALGIVGTAALNIADTPDVGLGTVIASGAVALLNGTGTFEDILTGQTWSAACNSVVQQGTAASVFGILTAAAHTVYLNIADAWAGVDAGMLATGKIVIEWKHMSS